MITIEEILNLPDGEVVEAVGGTIHITSPRIEKPRGDGTTYVQQSFTLSGPGWQIPGTIYDHAIGYEHEEGKYLIWASMKSRNGRFGGVTMGTVEGGGSLFSRKPPQRVLKISSLGSLRTQEGYDLIKDDPKRHPKVSPKKKNE